MHFHWESCGWIFKKYLLIIIWGYDDAMVCWHLIWYYDEWKMEFTCGYDWSMIMKHGYDKEMQNEDHRKRIWNLDQWTIKNYPWIWSMKCGYGKLTWNMNSKMEYVKWYLKIQHTKMQDGIYPWIWSVIMKHGYIENTYNTDTDRYRHIENE